MSFKELLGLPVLASEHGEQVDNLIIYVHWLMVALFVGWMGYFLYCLWRFRKNKNSKGDYVGVKSHASNYIEGVVALVEMVLLFGLSVPLWAVVADDFPDEENSTVIQVMAQQFAWNARYRGEDGEFGDQDPRFISSGNTFGIDPEDPKGEDDITAPLNTMYAPVNKPVILKISSKDVIHSFALHAMRVCQDAIPGLMIPTHFVPTKEGEYLITCAQLCGNSHYAMSGYFNVVSQEEFDEWMAQQSPAATGSSSGESIFE
jgi:cytochrome c oxidase subunit 2